jgi:hypothetical protein
MGSQTDYFERIGYRPKYFLGERVFGHYKKIPFVGTIGNDTVINETEGPRISIHLDLPMKVDKEYKSLIIVKHKDIKRLTAMDEIENPTKPPKQTKVKK